MSTKRLATAFLTGLLFAFGLALSGMTLPSKIVGFFDFSRGLDSWDPSLGLVMAGSMFVYMPVYRIVRDHHKPMWDALYRLPESNLIDARLIAGAVLFGMGWALGGYCPGPALTSLGALSSQALVFVASMVVGMLFHQRVDARLRRRRS